MSGIIDRYLFGFFIAMTNVMALSALADELDDLVNRTIKGVSTVSKYGGTL